MTSQAATAASEPLKKLLGITFTIENSSKKVRWKTIPKILPIFQILSKTIIVEISVYFLLMKYPLQIRADSKIYHSKTYLPREFFLLACEFFFTISYSIFLFKLGMLFRKLILLVAVTMLFSCATSQEENKKYNSLLKFITS